jgi:hypothetical protein
VLSAARVDPSKCSEHRHYSIARKLSAMRARIPDERSNKLQCRRLLRRTSAHNPVPVFIGEYREVLHRPHICPTGQRFPRAWDVDVPPGALSAVLEALTIACQLFRVFDCGRAPCKGDTRNQPNRQDARISHRQLALSRIRGCRGLSSQGSPAITGRRRCRLHGHHGDYAGRFVSTPPSRSRKIGVDEGCNARQRAGGAISRLSMTFCGWVRIDAFRTNPSLARR